MNTEWILIYGEAELMLVAAQFIAPLDVLCLLKSIGEKLILTKLYTA